MQVLKANHYGVRTDFELMSSLFDELQQIEIADFKSLEEKIKRLNFSSFSDLFNYISGPNCDPHLATTIEEIADRLRMSEPKRNGIFTSSREVGNYLTAKLTGHKQEEFWAFYLDNSNHIIAEKMISKGTLDRSLVHPRDVFRWAVLFNCASMIVVHNHPSGNLKPSQSDFEMTKNLIANSKLMKINFLDHFIVGKGHYLSMKENEFF